MRFYPVDSLFDNTNIACIICSTDVNLCTAILASAPPRQIINNHLSLRSSHNYNYTISLCILIYWQQSLIIRQPTACDLYCANTIPRSCPQSHTTVVMAAKLQKSIITFIKHQRRTTKGHLRMRATDTARARAHCTAASVCSYMDYPCAASQHPLPAASSALKNRSLRSTDGADAAAAAAAAVRSKRGHTSGERRFNWVLQRGTGRWGCLGNHGDLGLSTGVGP